MAAYFWENFMRIYKWVIASSALAVFALTSCASTSNTAPATSTYGATEYGVVQSIDMVKKDHSGIGVGAVAGAVVGGLIGHQVGSGRGNTAATIAGAAGGAYAGNEIEKRRADNDGYRLQIRLDNGSIQTIDQETNPSLRIGDRVRIVNGTAQPA
jgi:outer membrane lipoprotein SlyB